MISSETSTATFTGNNSSVTAYAIPFKFFDNGDIYCHVVDANNDVTELSLTTDFALTGAGEESGGTLVTVAPYDSTHTLRISRRPDYLQERNMREGQLSAMENLEKGLDVVVTQVQKLVEMIHTGGLDSLAIDKTITAAATTGAQTINKAAGSVNFAAAASSLVVTNSLVNTKSVIIATVATNDATTKAVQAVAANGSFTLYPDTAPTAETRINFIVIN
jgi:hypothetical protein